MKKSIPLAVVLAGSLYATPAEEERRITPPTPTVERRMHTPRPAVTIRSRYFVNAGNLLKNYNLDPNTPLRFIDGSKQKLVRRVEFLDALLDEPIDEIVTPPREKHYSPLHNFASIFKGETAVRVGRRELAYEGAAKLEPSGELTVMSILSDRIRDRETNARLNATIVGAFSTIQGYQHTDKWELEGFERLFIRVLTKYAMQFEREQNLK